MDYFEVNVSGYISSAGIVLALHTRTVLAEWKSQQMNFLLLTERYIDQPFAAASVS